MSETVEASSNECEMLVLGAILDSPKNASIALKMLEEEDFFDPQHKSILKAIRDIFHEKKVSDIHLVHEKLKEIGNFEHPNALAYLMNLSMYAGTSIHIEAYCEDLKKFTLKRLLVLLNNALSTDLKQNADSTKIIDKLKKKIDDIQRRQVQNGSALKFLLENNSEQQLIDGLQKISPGVSTGYTIGQESIKIPGGALSVIAMPTSHGKTATLINFSLGVLNHHPDKSVYFFTYEESGASIQTLFINTYINKELSKNNRESIIHFFGKDELKYIKAHMHEEFLRDKNAFFTHLFNSGRLKIFYSDMSADELIKAIHFIKDHTNVGLVCIDYMQLLKLLNWSYGSRQEELKYICNKLKDCAIETGLPILLGAQFSRQVTMEAELSPIYIREAADVEHIANLLIGGWNRNFEGFTKEGNKGRNGKSIPKESAIYFEIMKGRGIGNGHNSVLDFNGNTGKIENRQTSGTKNQMFG
jgi:replicative DNA helicase